MGQTHKRSRSTTCGILVVDKPLGMTSMDVVAIVRGRAGGPRTGHAGTLDPCAEGVLVLGLGRATKSLGRFMSTPKRYRTVIDLSAFTDTDDLEASTKYRTHRLSHGGMRLVPSLGKHQSLRHFHSATLNANLTKWQIQRIHHTQLLPFLNTSPGDILLSP